MTIPVIASRPARSVCPVSDTPERAVDLCMAWQPTAQVGLRLPSPGRFARLENREDVIAKPGTYSISRADYPVGWAMQSRSAYGIDLAGQRKRKANHRPESLICLGDSRRDGTFSGNWPAIADLYGPRHHARRKGQVREQSRLAGAESEGVQTPRTASSCLLLQRGIGRLAQAARAHGLPLQALPQVPRWDGRALIRQTKGAGMTTITLTRTNAVMPDESALQPVREFLFGVIDGAHQADKAGWRKFWKRLINLEPGELAVADMKFPRSGPYHRRHMAIEGALFDAQERFTSFEQFRVWLKVGAGWVDWCAGPRGGVVPIPKTISYSGADQAEFEQFHTAVMQFLRGPHAAKFLWRHLDDPSEMMDSVLGEFQE